MNTRHQLIDADTGAVIVPKLMVADTFWHRFRGLQCRARLADDEGLLLVPCRSVHTHWMRFSIDVAMLDPQGFVLAVFTNVRPWRIVRRVQGTRAIVESVSGMLAPKVRVGARLKVAPHDYFVSSAPPSRR